MKKICFSLIILFVCHHSFAQSPDEWKEASAESQGYHKYRLEMSTPAYGLDKIQDLISKLKPDDNSDDMGGTVSLDQKTYLSLSLREKFTYHMIHPESYSQNCDAMPPIQNEQKKISAQLPDAFGENNWSEHQTKFFLANRDSVIALMKDCITKDKHVGLNFKHVIVDINAKEMIPFIVSAYNEQKKDHDLLTVLMLLMKDNEYDQFLTSSSYKKLYANTDYETSYKAYLNFNAANEALIIKRATDFYNGLPK
jgi:hypothetical protein